MVKKEKQIHLLQVGDSDWSAYVGAYNLQVEYLAYAEIGEFVRRRKESLEQYQKQEKRLAALRESGIKESQLPEVLLQKPKTYSGLLLTGMTYPDTIADVVDLFDVYTVFYDATKGLFSENLLQILQKKQAQLCDTSRPEKLLKQLSRSLFTGQNGGKFPVSDLEVVSSFQGEISLDGQSQLILTGDFGQEFQQIAYLRYNLPHDSTKETSLFFEHLPSQGVKTKIAVQLIQEGSVGDIAQEWLFDMTDRNQQLRLTSEVSGSLSISIWAKGTGELALGPCHCRHSRGTFGEFVLGGQRFVDDQQQEFMYYFDPQDFQPPLCVYFSGFRTAEGFEGYGMMKNMKTPFMLICDPRLEGGSFYLGSPELEQKIVDVIQEKLTFLGFDRSQLILSGLSMGTFGATYYGAKLAPHAIVIGKPVLSLGEVALRERLNRPGGFPTSLDILSHYTGNLSERGAEELNNRFWNQFATGDFSQTTFAIAYMQHDDYDSTAFEQLLKVTRGTGATVIGRGWPGRHVDGGSGPIMWFLKQYQTILEKDFGRQNA